MYAGAIVSLAIGAFAISMNTYPWRVLRGIGIAGVLLALVFLIPMDRGLAPGIHMVRGPSGQDIQTRNNSKHSRGKAEATGRNEKAVSGFPPIRKQPEPKSRSTTNNGTADAVVDERMDGADDADGGDDAPQCGLRLWLKNPPCSRKCPNQPVFFCHACFLSCRKRARGRCALIHPG